MSLISSWTQQRRRRSLELLKLALACGTLASAALAETATAHLGAHFRAADGRPFQDFGSVSEVLDQLKLDMQLFVKGFDDCPAIVAGRIESATPRDTLRDTWTVIQTLQVDCWAVLQVDPAVPVAAAGPADWITPEMMRGVMENAERLSAGDELWRQTLTSFPGGDITCKDAERCRLSLPDGRNPPEQSLEFDLILAMADERLIRVVQMVYGRAGFVYGVH